MSARAEVLQREVDLNGLGEAVHAAIRSQKRGMIRGLVGLGALVALCVGLFAATGDVAILWPALGLLAIGAYAIAGDLARLAMTRRWGERSAVLDAASMRGERREAVWKLGGTIAAAVVPAMVLPEHAVLDVVSTVLQLAGLVGALHYAFVLRALTRDLEALRD